MSPVPPDVDGGAFVARRLRGLAVAIEELSGDLRLLDRPSVRQRLGELHLEVSLIADAIDAARVIERRE